MHHEVLEQLFFFSKVLRRKSSGNQHVYKLTLRA